MSNKPDWLYYIFIGLLFGGILGSISPRFFVLTLFGCVVIMAAVALFRGQQEPRALDDCMADAIARHYPVSTAEVWAAHRVVKSWDKVLVLCEAMCYGGYGDLMQAYFAINREGTTK